MSSNHASNPLFRAKTPKPHHNEDNNQRLPLTIDLQVWSPTAYNARGFVIGRMFNRKGEVVASITQQGLIRKAGTPSSSSKL
ncbi:putative palmitoyl-CoA hydrolase [Helianthus anomalus]